MTHPAQSSTVVSSFPAEGALLDRTSEKVPTRVSSEARHALDATGYAELKGVGTAFSEGTLHLMGDVSSFFLKQVAQHAVADVPHVATIKNEIRVTRDGR